MVQTAAKQAHAQAQLGGFSRKFATERVCRENLPPQAFFKQRVGGGKTP